MDLADVLPPADGRAQVREDWHGELVASLESVSDTLGLVTQLLSALLSHWHLHGEPQWQRTAGTSSSHWPGCPRGRRPSAGT